MSLLAIITTDIINKKLMYSIDTHKFKKMNLSLGTSGNLHGVRTALVNIFKKYYVLRGSPSLITLLAVQPKIV